MLTDDTGSTKHNSIKMLGVFMKLIIQNVKISNLLNVILTKWAPGASIRLS